MSLIWSTILRFNSSGTFSSKLRFPAGNRSFDENVPEELNRRIVDHISDINFTLTEHARNYLLNEGLRGDRIIKSGGFMTEIIAKNMSKIHDSDVLGRMGPHST